jgi:hypothetical protein
MFWPSWRLAGLYVRPPPAPRPVSNKWVRGGGQTTPSASAAQVICDAGVRVSRAPCVWAALTRIQTLIVVPCIPSQDAGPISPKPDAPAPKAAPAPAARATSGSPPAASSRAAAPATAAGAAGQDAASAAAAGGGVAAAGCDSDALRKQEEAIALMKRMIELQEAKLKQQALKKRKAAAPGEP